MLSAQQWTSYCALKEIQQTYASSISHATFKEEMSFLAHLFHNKEQKHGVIVFARSALLPVLPSKDGTIFSKDPNVSRLVKGIFKLILFLPKYVATSDSKIILSFINHLPQIRN